jgi:alpha-L-arabinofuranosidase
MKPTSSAQPTIRIDPTPLYALSPGLYMQFMEPLGATDSSVDAAWNFLEDDWRPDLLEVAQKLAPPLIRYGGCLSSYYRWREGVGPRNQRQPMYNLLWGGIESNQVGTHEFVDFCRRVGAQPFYCVNFESDGRQHWARPKKGGVRSAGPAEAAAWVDYCNNPANKERRRNGAAKPFNLKLWQIGNETSYDKRGYDVETAARRTVAFAKAMRQADPDLELIGWGDSGWAPRMLEVAGTHLDYLAFHLGMSAGSDQPDSPLRGVAYRDNWQRTWDALMLGPTYCEPKIHAMRAAVSGTNMKLALTECHYTLPGRDRGDVLSTWAAGVSYARILNLYQRHGDLLKIATCADFFGNRWQVNAIMIPTRRGQAFMLPVAHVMALYRHHSGNQAVAVTGAPKDLDITASRTGSKVYLHVVNANRTRPIAARFQIDGLSIDSGRAFEIAAPPEFETIAASTTLDPVEKALPRNMTWTFPAASVSAVELRLAAR